MNRQYLTIVYSLDPDDKPVDLWGDSRFVAGSWSHAMRDRDNALAEVARLTALVRDAHIEGHKDGGQCWSENFSPGKRFALQYAQNDWRESDAKKAAEAAEGGES
jgi:hypothetical protein